MAREREDFFQVIGDHAENVGMKRERVLQRMEALKHRQLAVLARITELTRPAFIRHRLTCRELAQPLAFY